MKSGQSFRPSFYPGVFFQLYHHFFLNFGMGLETHMKLYLTEPDFSEIFFVPKIGKMDQNWAQNRDF